MTTDEILTYLEKPKSMPYIRKLLEPIFCQARKKFGDTIVEIVEREQWGPNFDAYYDIWVRHQSSEIQKYFTDSLHKLQDDEFIFILAQVKETDDYGSVSGKAEKRHSKHISVA